VAEQPTAAGDHRKAVRALVKALRGATVAFTPGEAGTILVDGAEWTPTDEVNVAAAKVLAERFPAYGIEELTLTSKAAEADLQDLARLLASAPSGDDPIAYFAARMTAVDATGIPRRLRARASKPVVPPAEGEPPIKNVAPAGEPMAAVSPPSDGDAAETPAEFDTRSERLIEAIELPKSADPDLAALLTNVQATTEIEALTPLLEQLVARADLAFRTGKHTILADAIGGLVAIEHVQVEADPTDERRRTFAQAVRKLASPLILRQLAGMRHRRIDDAELTQRLQAILYRFGTDGAEALIDEYVSVSSAEERTICLDALRGLRRTNDALFALVRDTRDLVVRQAAGILGELRDERGEQLLIELLRHPDARARRAAVAALARFTTATAIEGLGLALLDESPLVRTRSVAALTDRGPAAVAILAPLLDGEADREVLYSTVTALGTIGTPEAVQLLIRVALGETEHPRKKSASFRIHACNTLVAVRSPQAMACVQGLREDRDREVRDAAVRLVAQASRRTTSMRAVTTV
jgi:HEAT repeat protein